MVCNRVGGNWSCVYDTDHRYVEFNEVATYVDLNESDVSQVALLTDYTALGKMGREYAKNTFNLSNMQGIDDPNAVIPLDNVIEQVSGDQVEGALKRLGHDDKYFWYLFGGAGFSKYVARGYGSSVVVLGVKGLADPYGTAIEMRGYGYVFASASVGVGATYGVTKVFRVALSAPAKGLLIGVISIYGDLLLQGIHKERNEIHLCEHAETDDFEVFIGPRKGSCGVGQHSSCEAFPVVMINKGELLEETAIGPSFDFPCVPPYSPDFSPYTSTEEDCSNPVTGGCVYSQRLDALVNMSAGEVNSGDVTAQYSGCYSSFNQSGKVYHKIKVLPGIKCVSDPTIFSDIPLPPLSRFQTNHPFISRPVFPSTVHRGDLVNVSVGVVYDSVITSGVQLVWEFYDLNGSKAGPFVADMSAVSSPGIYRNWSALIGTSAYPVGLIRFKVVVGTLSVNDNDQRMFEVRVVEDAGSGRDAGGSPNKAMAVGYSKIMLIVHYSNILAVF